jgi:hypothetical protein
MKPSKEILQEMGIEVKKKETKTSKSFRLNSKSIEIIDRFRKAFNSESELVDAALEVFDARYEAARKHNKK